MNSPMAHGTRTVPKGFVVRGFTLVCALLCSSSGSTAPAGAEAELAHQLSRPLTVTWQAAPLGEVLRRLGKAQGVVLFIDRRIDPSRPVTLTANNKSLASLLDQLAEKEHLSVTPFGPVVYLGPPGAAAWLLDARERHRGSTRSSSPRLRMALRNEKPTEWDRLDEPREILLLSAATARVRLRSEGLVPQDLWPAGELPPMPLRDRLSLLLVGFSLDWEVDARGRGVTIVPAHPFSRSKLLPVPKLAELIRKKPPARIEQRYTLRVREQPLHAVLKQVAKSAGKRLSVEEEAKERLSTRVTFSVEGTTLEELLRIAAGEAGLAAEVTGESLIVSVP